MTTREPDSKQRLIAQAERIYERYAAEVIEAYNFCPWAAEARRGGSVLVNVVLGEHVSSNDVSLLTRELAEREATIIGLLVFPQLALDAVNFQHFAAQVRVQSDSLYPRGQSPWAIADFHPLGATDLSSAERSVAFIRRSPDPTLQLVRHSTLSALKRPFDGGTQFVDMATFNALDTVQTTQRRALHQRVAENNLRKLGDVAQAVTETLADIHRDRNQSYGRIALSTPTWLS